MGTRPARTSRRRTRPWLFFALLATVVVLLVNAAMSARSPGPQRQQAQQSWLDLALPAIQQSSQQGQDVHDVMAQALALSPTTITSHLAEDVVQTGLTLASVEKLNPPAAMRTAQSLLVAALDLRATGTKALRAAMMTVLSSQPPDAGVKALVDVGVDLQAGDRIYSLFRQSVPGGTAVPASTWVSDASTWSSDMVTVFVTSLRAHGSLIPVANVSVLTVTTNPQPANMTNGVEVLPFAHLLNLQVVVANTGNQPESNLTVTASVAPSAIGPTQSVRNFVTLLPGQSKTVSLGSLRLVDNQDATLTVTIDTAPGETDITDNSKVLNLRMQ